MLDPLDYIHVKNWQSHRDTLLRLHAGINIITGIGDSGKTALMRAVDWAKDNDPAGQKFKHGRDPTITASCKLGWADGDWIKHAKGKGGKSKYTTSKDPKGFEGVGRNVPRQVTDLIAMEDINFQGQFDTPYLIWLTAGDIATIFNEIADMERYGEWQSSIAANQRVVKKQIKDSYAEQTRLQDKLLRFEALPELEEVFKKLQAAEAEHKVAYDDAYGLYEAAEDVFVSEEDTKTIRKKMDMAKTAISLLESAREKSLTVTENVAIIKAAEDLARQKEYVEKLEKAISVGEEALVAERAHNELLSAMAEIDELIAREDQVEHCLQGLQIELELMRQTLHNVGKCPYCLGDIDEEAVERIIKRLEA